MRDETCIDTTDEEIDVTLSDVTNTVKKDDPSDADLEQSSET